MIDAGTTPGPDNFSRFEPMMGADGRIVALRLWRAPRQPRDGTPLWIGTVQTLAYQRPFGLFGLWSPDADVDDAYAMLRDDLEAFEKDFKQYAIKLAKM